MGDHDRRARAAGRLAGKEPAQRRAHDCEVFDIDASIGLVDERERRLAREQLEQLRELELAARKAVIHVSVEEPRTVQSISQALHRSRGRLRWLAHRGELAERYAMNGGWPLIEEADPQPRPLMAWHRRDLVTSKPQLAGRDRVARQAHDGHHERALARAVRTEENMTLSGGDREIDVPQHRASAHAHADAVELEEGRLGDRHGFRINRQRFHPRSLLGLCFGDSLRAAPPVDLEHPRARARGDALRPPAPRRETG